MRKSRRPLFKNIFWWLGYTVAAIWMQFAIAGVDFFMPAVICSMQEENPRQTFWLVTMFALIQEGTGAIAFGSSTLWYCSALILMYYGRWMFDANNFFFIVLVSCALGLWNLGLTLLIASRLRALKAYRKLVPEYGQGLWKRPKQMLEKVNLLLRSAPNEPILLHAKGSILFQLKDTVEAIRYYNDAIDLSPDLTVALHDRGTAYVRANLAYMAIVDYDKAISLSPNNPHLYISHGSADLVLKDYDSMCVNYRKGCELGFCKELNWGIARGMCKR